MTPPPSPDRIELSPEEMRRLGYGVVDLLVEHFSTLRERPVGSRSPPESLDLRLREPPPPGPGDPLELLETLRREVFSRILHVDHPRFLAFVPGPNNFVSAMADAIASGMNVFVGTWFAGSAAAEVERGVVDWLRDLCGMPSSAGGLFVSGGSMANLTALGAARQSRLGERATGAVVYASDQTHSSVFRALRILGFAPDQIRVIPSDERFRIPVAVLRSRVEADRNAGLRPFCVVANAGTTNTGAVDPLRDLVALCREEALWLHADAAFGAPAALTEEGRSLLDGLGEVDSLSLDPHKWLFQSFDCGCVLLRDPRCLLESYQVMPEYLRDTEGRAGEINFANYGIELTRGFRALKLWLSLRTFGVDAFRAAVQRGIRNAETAEAWIAELPDWEIVSSAALSVVCFRFAPAGWTEEEIDSLNGRMVEALLAEGRMLATSTVLRGRTVLRLCTINPRLDEESIRGVVEHLREVAKRLLDLAGKETD